MSRFVLLDEMSGSFRMGDGSEPPLKQTSVVVKFAPGLVPVLKHGNHDQKSHAGKGGVKTRVIDPQQIADVFTGTYTTDTGLEFTLTADQLDYQSMDRGPKLVPTAGGKIIVNGEVVGEWARGVDEEEDTMHALFLTVGKNIRGKPLPDAQNVRGQGIALAVQKQTEQAARDLGVSNIRVHAVQDGTAAWANERFGYRFETKPKLRVEAGNGDPPKNDQERAIPLGGRGLRNNTYVSRGYDGLIYFTHPDQGSPGVQEKLIDIERRFKSDNPDDWPAPHEILNLGTGMRPDDDVVEGRTLGEFALSWGWDGVKPSDHVTKQHISNVMRVMIDSETKPTSVSKHGGCDQRNHNSIVVRFAPGLVPVLKHGNQKPEVTYPRCGKGGAERERWKLQ